MKGLRGRGGIAALLVVGAAAAGTAALVVVSSPRHASRAGVAAAPLQRRQWVEKTRTGSSTLTGQVPLAVSHKTAPYVRPHSPTARLRVNFGFPLQDKAGLDALIAQEAKTHRYLTRAQLYARFSPPPAQLRALEGWLQAKGFTITHVGLDRMSVAASATTAVVEKTLHVQINDYVRPALTFHGLKIQPYVFYGNTTAPTVPARLGIESVSGLSDVDRFYSEAQLSPQGVRPVEVRSGGYFPGDLRSMYDVAGHGYDGTGQTLGFTLWGAAERQPAMTTFATATGDQLITVDPVCIATGNSPTVPSSCTTQTVAGDHLFSILENGNTNNQFGGNVETALDIEQAHGIATHAAMKYYLADCTATPPVGSGLSNGSSCNGTDVGMEEAIEDAANDPTLHSVSNSWAFGGEAEWGLADPFLLASENSFAIAAAAGTTFYFSTGDSGTYQSGYPSDSQYVVGVGGTTLFSTGSTSTLSTEDTWAAGGSWCSNIVARPAWQTGPGVAANAPCPGRAIPDISAVADTNSSVRFTSSTNATGGTQSGGVGGTSVAAPELNGMEAVTENFIAAQTYAGPTPQVGFEAPIMYQIGNSGHYDSYFRDVYCGNTASPASGPDGDAAQPGWDAATGWGAPDWFNYSIGYAIALGATNLSVPASLARNYSWLCARTPGNSSERGLSCPTSSTCYAVGAASGGTPWYAKFLASGSWGAVNTFYKSVDGGQTWFPSNGDMTSIACTGSSTCVEVGDGGRIKTTSDGGSTWSDTPSGFNKGLTQVTCPSSSTCYAAGDRGTVLKSTDGGSTWSYLHSTDGNPIYGLACPTDSVCYATDIYAHVIKTSDGGATWTWQSTPVTTPGVAVPGSGGPNPFAGLFGISCSDASTCVAVGGFPPVGTDPPIVTTTDGGATWTLRTSNSGSGNYLASVSCLPGTTTCTAVGRGGSIVTTTDLVTWTKVTSGTTNMLNGVTCLSTGFCVASGQNGTIDVFNGSAWTATTGNGGAGFLASVTCPSAGTCFAAGKQGVTIATTNGGASWTQQAGGGTTQQMNGVSCTDASTCVAVGNAGTILRTSNGGQTWLAQTSGTTSALNGVSCWSGTACTAVGAAGTIRTTADGSTWNTVTSGTTNALNGVSCASGSRCVADGAAGTIVTSSDGGNTWAASTSGVTATLSAVACPSATCYAAGAVVSGSAVMLKSTDGGSTWTSQPSGSAQALSGVACVNDSTCFAGGAIGTVVGTVDGSTWTQQGNPISGPVSALNAGPTGITAVNAAACSAVRCLMGTASSGNIMETTLLTVTVHTTSTVGTTPNLTGIQPSDPALTYSPASEAGNVTGTLSCSTTANGSTIGTFPISGCSGLADSGFSVVYDYADSSHTVAKSNQTITFDPIPAHTYGDADFDVSATASSGLAVTFAATGQCTISGATVHITGAGSCTVSASQAGDDTHGAAADVSQTFAIAKADQTISFDPLPDATFGDPDFDVSATASSGLDVTFAASGQCTVTDSTVSITGAGSCTITASQAGDANYNPAPDASQTFAIAKADQTISFGALPDATFGDADFTVHATASSGDAVTFAAAGQCTISGATVHIAAAGSCTITASQAGDGNYNAAPDVPRTFAIAKADQMITFGAITDKTFGDADFGISATSSSGLTVSLTVASGPCTLSSPTSPAQVHIAGAGACVIVASQAGDANYNPAPNVSRSFTVAKANQTITFAALPNKTYGDPDFAVHATATSGAAVTFKALGDCTVSGGTVHLTGAGSCQITASQTGNAQYNPAPDVSRSFTIAKAKSTTSYTGATGSVLNGSKVTLSGSLHGIGGTALAGEPLTFTVGAGASAQTCTGTTGATGTASCSITLNQPTGTIPVSVTFAGDANYLASSGSGTLSVFTAYSLSKSALAQAQALLAGARRSDADRLRGVVRELSAALDPSLWIDGNHVSSRRGDRVFELHQDAVQDLEYLQKHGSISDSSLQAVIDTIVHADAVLAQQAVNDAIAGHGDPRKIADAQNELAKAAKSLAKGDEDGAIGHYENAWQDALDATRFRFHH